MANFSDPNFWSTASANVGTVQNDGSMKYVLLDKQYKMMPLVRDKDITFLHFVARDAQAKKCDVIVNGNYYGLDKTGSAWVALNKTADPSDVEIQGQVIKGGKVIAGDSRPDSFWFGQLSVITGDAWGWYYVADKGDPPEGARTLAAIGGVGPMIAGAYTFGTSSINTLNYGVGNAYRPGAPAGVPEPTTGQPPPVTKPYLLQRNNETFRSASQRSPETGKTILAYCSLTRMLLVAVQPHGAKPGQTHANLVSVLADRGFDAVIFMDGSDSSTLVVRGSVIVAPGERKDDSIDVGVGFFK
jgi:hypothetical protein